MMVQSSVIFKMTWHGFQVVQFFPMVHGLPGHGYCCQKLFHIQLVITVVFFSVFFELSHGTQMKIQVQTS